MTFEMEIVLCALWPEVLPEVICAIIEIGELADHTISVYALALTCQSVAAAVRQIPNDVRALHVLSPQFEPCNFSTYGVNFRDSTFSRPVRLNLRKFVNWLLQSVLMWRLISEPDRLYELSGTTSIVYLNQLTCRAILRVLRRHCRGSVRKCFPPLIVQDMIRRGDMRPREN
jgi:hypothetical protein